MGTDGIDDRKRPTLDELYALMESPLYWTMRVEEGLALARPAPDQGDEARAGFRRRALTWVRTGVWGTDDKP